MGFTIRLLLTIFLLFFITKVNGKEPTYSFERVFDKAAKDPSWSSLNLREKLLKVRSVALKNKTVSDPVSDRYQITCYGGPIDLVHFLMLAAEAQKTNIDMKDRLYKEWLQEGGPQHLNGFNPQFPCEAHPDDLPSNALGALFGEELQKSGLNTNLKDEFLKFIKPLIPVPDSIAKTFSHRLGVMGLPKKIDKLTENSRYIWFTAEPLNLTKLINYESKKQAGKDLCKTVLTGKEGLKEAGFKIQLFKNKSIIIKRF